MEIVCDMIRYNFLDLTVKYVVIYPNVMLATTVVLYVNLEQLRGHDTAMCNLFCSVNVGHSVDFEIDSHIDLGINPKLCKYLFLPIGLCGVQCSLFLLILPKSLQESYLTFCNVFPASDHVLSLSQIVERGKLLQTHQTATSHSTSWISCCRETGSKWHVLELRQFYTHSVKWFICNVLFLQGK